MDEFVHKAAGLGLPVIVLLIMMATTGLTGAAAITAALALLGPGGMIGGIILLGMIGLAAEILSKYGLDTLLVAIYLKRSSCRTSAAIGSLQSSCVPGFMGGTDDGWFITLYSAEPFNQSFGESSCGKLAKQGFYRSEGSAQRLPRPAPEWAGLGRSGW